MAALTDLIADDRWAGKRPDHLAGEASRRPDGHKRLALAQVLEGPAAIAGDGEANVDNARRKHVRLPATPQPDSLRAGRKVWGRWDGRGEVRTERRWTSGTCALTSARSAG